MGERLKTADYLDVRIAKRKHFQILAPLLQSDRKFIWVSLVGVERDA